MEIIEGIKKLFPHKIVEITIQSVDVTEYILSEPEYTNELRERIEEYKTKQDTISLKKDDLI